LESLSGNSSASGINGLFFVSHFSKKLKKVNPARYDPPGTGKIRKIFPSTLQCLLSDSTEFANDD